ncbi:MAG: hypothetical protein IJ468_00095 [Lachnospiraceae bacterium]|nr:hypothetical protein [Lachnospiraceae bacterium]
MAKKDLTMDIVQAQLKVDMDRKIIDYLDTHKEERDALERKVVSQELHSAVLTLIGRAREDGIIEVNPTLTNEDVWILLALGVLPEKQEKETDCK